MSERSTVISRLLKSRASRESYLGAKLKVLIPSQIRALRLKSQSPRQEDLANAAEMKQSRISAMETPGAVNFNLETLVRIAAALKVVLVVKFVSFSEMLQWENDFSQDQFDVAILDRDAEFQEPRLTVEAESRPLASHMWESLGSAGQQVPVISEASKQPYHQHRELQLFPSTMMGAQQAGGANHAASGCNPC